MKTILTSLLVVAAAGLSNVALADDASPRGTITLGTTIVYGRLPRPQVAFEIERLTPSFSASSESLRVLDRIEKAVYEDLF